MKFRPDANLKPTRLLAAGMSNYDLAEWRSQFETYALINLQENPDSYKLINSYLFTCICPNLKKEARINISPDNDPRTNITELIKQAKKNRSIIGE